MCDINPTKQLVELERFGDVKRALAREALLAQLPASKRRVWRRPLAAIGALLVTVGTRLEHLGGIEAQVGAARS